MTTRRLQTARLVTAALFFATLIILVPLATATTLVADDFEGETIGATPSGPGYTWGGDGVTPAITALQTHRGTRAVLMTSTSTSNAGGNALHFSPSSQALCGPSVSNTLDVWLYMPTVPGIGNRFRLLFDQFSSPLTFPPELYIDLSGQVHISATGTGTDTIVADMFGANTWHEISLTCNATNSQFTFNSADLHAVGGSFPRTVTIAYSPSNYLNSYYLNDVRWSYTNNAETSVISGFQTYVDDLGDPTAVVATVTITAPTTGSTLTSSTVGFTSTLSAGTTFSLPVDHIEYTASLSGTTYRCKGYTAPTYPCSMSLPNGAYTATAIGEDVADGIQTATSASISFTVTVPGGGSTTHLTSPTNGQTIASGAAVHLAATLTDSVGDVHELVFEIHGSSVLAQCIDTTAPYACDITVVDGSYTATVEGRNTGGDNVAPMDTAPVPFHVGAAPIPAPPSTHVGVSQLRGFDVDEAGRVAVARVADGNTVQVFAGQSLSPGATATDADCNLKNDGVSAYSTDTDTYVTYFECSNSGSRPANSMKIRSATLGSPVIPTTCAGFASGDITTGLDVNVPDTLREISGLTFFPIDFKDCQEGPGVKHVTTAWAFSTTNGQVGVFAATQNNNEPDHSDSAFISFDAGTSPNVAQFCAFADNAGLNHLGAVGLDASTSFYLPAVATTTSISTTPDAQIRFDYSLGGAYSLAKAISCAKARAILENKDGTSISVICTVAGQCPTGKAVGDSIWTHGTTAPTNSRAATISGNTAWAAYMDANGIHIVNATTGTETQLIARPEPGTFWDMRMDYSGSALWIAYTDNIYRYDVHLATCQSNCTNIVSNPVPTPSSSSSLTGSVGDNANALGDVFGGGSVGGALMLAIIYILCFSVGCYFIFNERVIGAVIGGVCGLAFSIFSDLLPPVITFLIVAIMIGLGAMRFWQGRSDGGM